MGGCHKIMIGSEGEQTWFLTPLLCMVLVMQAARRCFRSHWEQWYLPPWWYSEVFNKFPLLIRVKLVRCKEKKGFTLS